MGEINYTPFDEEEGIHPNCIVAIGLQSAGPTRHR